MGIKNYFFPTDDRPVMLLACLCDLGATYGKGMEFQSIIDSLERDSQNYKIVGFFRCAKLYVGTNKIKNVLPFGNVFFRMFVLVERSLGLVGIKFPSRQVQDWIFDLLVSYRMPKNTKVIYSLPGMLRSFRRAKFIGATTVLHGVVMHPNYNSALLSKLFPDGKYPRVWASGMVNQCVRSMAFVDRVICPSTCAAQSYLDYGYKSSTVDVVPLGYKTSIIHEIRSWTGSQPLKILYVGNVTKMKGCDVLLDAADALKNSNYLFNFVGEIQDDIRQRSKKLNKNIIFHGQRPALEFFSTCHVLVFPSLSEGQARVILEAGTYGMLVISGRAVHGDLVEDNVSGFLCDQNPNSIIELLAHIDTHRNEMIRLRKNLQDRCLSLTWEAFGIGVATRLCGILGVKTIN